MTVDSSRSIQETELERGLIKQVAEFLTLEEYKFQFIDETCLEMYLQGKFLTMRMLVYGSNKHLVIRVPAFIRNVNLRRMDVLLFLMAVMNDFFDIRFELAKDGRSLSAASNFILEDGAITRKQFMQCLMVVAYLVDENYPKLMKLVFGPDGAGDGISGDSGETSEPGGAGRTSLKIRMPQDPSNGSKVN